MKRHSRNIKTSLKEKKRNDIRRKMKVRFNYEVASAVLRQYIDELLSGKVEERIETSIAECLSSPLTHPLGLYERFNKKKYGKI